MPHKKKGHFTSIKKDGKNLKKEWKKFFWQGERSAEKKFIRKEIDDYNPEFENLLTQFEKLLDTLISFLPEQEIEIEPIYEAYPKPEATTDFYSNYTLKKQIYLNTKIINEEQYKILNKLEEFVLAQSTIKGDELVECAANRQDWEVIAKLAYDFLLTLEADHSDSNIFHYTEKGKQEKK